MLSGRIRIAWFLCLTMASAWAAAQTTPAKFLLELEGKQAGKADYQFTPAKNGFKVKAHYSFAAKGATVEATRDADLGPDYEFRSDSLEATANGVRQSVTMTADAASGKLTFGVIASGARITHTFDLHPGTVVLNNFDPSGVQTLIYLDAAHPQPGHRYWAMLAQGEGRLLPLEFTPSQPYQGALNEAAIALKHWHLSIAGTTGDVWTDTAGNLMEFAVPAQQFAYRRAGFVLKEDDDAPPASGPVPNADAAEERKVSFTSDGLKFPAILALPKHRTAPVPIIVLVSGSGPHDPDETIGPNKPFRDLAYGLAAHGIATLRYEKRTHLAPDTFRTHPDIDHEVTIDAVAALAFAAALPEADPKRVFLLGHSLGGTMAPVIAADRLQQSPGSVRGIIFLAGAALGPEETIERQLIFQAKRQGEDEAQLAALRKQWDAIFQTVNDPKTPAGQLVGSPPLRLPEGYWRSWISQDPAGELAKLGLPALVLRGAKDIQVSEEDFQALKKAGVAPGSESEEIDGLNHLMMPVAGDSTGDEYFQPSSVAPQVIQVIAGWIGTFH
jgi:uncharacterized protein